MRSSIVGEAAASTEAWQRTATGAADGVAPSQRSSMSPDSPCRQRSAMPETAALPRRTTSSSDGGRGSSRDGRDGAGDALWPLRTDRLPNGESARAAEPGVPGWADRRERVRGGDGSPNGREALDSTRRGAGAAERIVPVLLLLEADGGSIAVTISGLTIAPAVGKWIYSGSCDFTHGALCLF